MSTVIIYYPQGHYKQLLSNPVNIHLTSDRLTARICINLSILNNENKLDKSTQSLFLMKDRLLFILNNE